MKRQSPFWIVLFFLVFAPLGGHAQDPMQDYKQRKNVVRINLTNPLIFGDRSLIFGYERTIGQHQSFSVNFGQAALPKFGLFDAEIDDPSIQLQKNTEDKGFLVTADYRFYLKSEAKYPSPRGLYIGPYASHVFMGRDNSWKLETENFTGDLNTTFNFTSNSIGAELGYQFIIWKRIALDFVLIGPGVAWYSIEAKLDTTLDPDDEALVYEKINEILTERFPGYSFAIDDVDFRKTGSTNTTSVGYRYVIHLGFNF